MPAYVARPAIALPEHVVTTDEICDDIQSHHGGLPRLAATLRIVRATGVSTRRFARPLHSPTVSGNAPVLERNQVAFDDACRLAEEAAHRALAHAGLRPSDIDCVVTSHSTSWAVPGLDVHLVQALGLRPDVRRVPMASLACSGGAQALVRASDVIAAHPGSRCLVAVAETFSAIYHQQDTSVEAMIYKVLFGDGAGACVVTDEPLSPGLRIDSTWEYLLPHSRDRYWAHLDGSGFHFNSSRKAIEAAGEAMPALRKWLVTAAEGGRPFLPEWTVAHPGGPRILDSVAEELDLDRERLRHSWDSLAANGNLGGVAVLDVLARTHTDPPPAGAPGLLLAFGPGFVATGGVGAWHA
ncbi:PhlD [Streptomyces mobaraensis NBRC 13819 = DSM 40847]|uniref:PhlD n=2 Tax=Streptomyces mobaraensis TaxID=35621 RepID=A0A5N5WE91_STRMB|nr:polyketide synthase [Streptomyces mobaraensis]EME99388.1 putative polyketide synthase [Streptomyces mobaraensis NBRC 13819 = DSM 40847]KAB7851237.1 PhlD [Streptomyces mobaraensis]QTT75786.1 PhlD [Streptomyces mobaraensis NBRC 13819 = DSM 40847]